MPPHLQTRLPEQPQLPPQRSDPPQPSEQLGVQQLLLKQTCPPPHEVLVGAGQPVLVPLQVATD